MKTTPFSDYALSSGLSADEIYTVELLIDYVEYDLDPKYRNRETDFGEARFKPDYQPHFSKDVAIPAGIALQKLSWVSFQRSRDTKRPVRDLKALRFLPELSELFLIGNEVKDISPLAACPKLRRLNLGGESDSGPIAAGFLSDHRGAGTLGNAHHGLCGSWLPAKAALTRDLG